MTTAPSFLNEQPKTAPSADKLEALKVAAAQARQIALDIEDMEAGLKGLKASLNDLFQKKLPDLMDAAGVDHVGLPPEGNKPGMDFRLRPFYAASIAASWPEQKKQEAFATLTKYDAEDLIKAQVVAKLPKGDLEKAKELQEAARKMNITTELTQSVHAGTLTAWLREQVESGHFLPQEDLEKIGGTIGRVVKPEERKS